MAIPANTGKRPLSPHLTIYRPIITMVISIIHRITGVGLYIGMMVFALWLLLASSSAENFKMLNGMLASPLGRLLLLGFTWALLQHALGGIRHLFWDMGTGFEKETATKSAWGITLTSLLLTIAVWATAYYVR